MTKLSSGVSGIFDSVKLCNYIADFTGGVEALFAVNRRRVKIPARHQWNRFVVTLSGRRITSRPFQHLTPM